MSDNLTMDLQGALNHQTSVWELCFAAAKILVSGACSRQVCDLPMHPPSLRTDTHGHAHFVGLGPCIAHAEYILSTQLHAYIHTYMTLCVMKAVVALPQ